MDHDQAFKNLILDYPAAALEFFADASGLEGATITPVREEQLQEVLGSRYRRLDVPLRVEWPDGRRAAVLFVVEEETEPRRFSIHRLAHYCLDLAELLKTTQVVPDWNKQRKYVGFIDSYADLREDEVARYRAEYIENAGDNTMGLVATLLEEGWQKGRNEGRQEGRQEGEAALLLRLMERRFGPLAEALRERILSADAEALLLWSERILTASAPEDVVKD